MTDSFLRLFIQFTVKFRIKSNSRLCWHFSLMTDSSLSTWNWQKSWKECLPNLSLGFRLECLLRRFWEMLGALVYCRNSTVRSQLHWVYASRTVLSILWLLHPWWHVSVEEPKNFQCMGSRERGLSWSLILHSPKAEIKTQPWSHKQVGGSDRPMDDTEEDSIISLLY